MKRERLHSSRAVGWIVLSIFICQFLFQSCRPKGILHSWELRKVLVDLHKTDAVLQVAGLKYGNEEEKTIYYAQVLEKHGITQAQFDSSLVWYTAHPQLFDKIYPRVLRQLKSEEDRFVAMHEAELSLHPMVPKEEKPALRQTFTPNQLDSVLWVTSHGYPSMWNIRPVSVTIPYNP